MTAKTQKQTNSSQGRTNDDIEVRVASLELRMSEILIPMLNRIELSQAAMKTSMDTMRFVPIKDFSNYQKEAEDKFATSKDLAGTNRLLYWILGLVGSVFMLGVAAFIGVVIK